LMYCTQLFEGCREK